MTISVVFASPRFLHDGTFNGFVVGVWLCVQCFRRAPVSDRQGLIALMVRIANETSWQLADSRYLLNHRRRNRGAGGTGPQLSACRGLAALGPQLCDCDLVLHWCNSKIEQLQHIHKPHVTFYMRRLYLMAAPSLMFHFLESFRRSLLLEARFSAWNLPNTVWRSPDPLAAIRGPTSKGRGRGEEKGGMEGRGGEGGEEGGGKGWVCQWPPPHWRHLLPPMVRID